MSQTTQLTPAESSQVITGTCTKIQKAASQSTHRLTDLLTRPVGDWETARDTGDAHRGLRLVSVTRRDIGDEEDARRTAHNPATAARPWLSGGGYGKYPLSRRPAARSASCSAR